MVYEIFILLSPSAVIGYLSSTNYTEMEALDGADACCFVSLSLPLNECTLVPYKQNSDNRAQISDYKCLKINEMKGK